MTPIDLLPFLGLVLIAVLLFWIVRRLSSAEDWVERVSQTHATLSSRISEYGFWTVVNLSGAFRERGRRTHRTFATLISGSLFGVVVAPALIVSDVIHPILVSGDTTAVAAGIVVWSAIVEVPGLPRRLGPHFESGTVIPVMALVFIVCVLDALVCGIALGGIVDGETVKSAATGAALVAVGDLVSALLGLTAAAMLPPTQPGAG